MDSREEEIPFMKPPPIKKRKINDEEYKKVVQENDEEAESSEEMNIAGETGRVPGTHDAADDDDDEENNEDLLDEEEELLRAIEEDDAEENVFNKEALMKLIGAFEKHVSRNQELRLKYPKQPEKFMDSEVDLDEDIRRFGVISAYPELLRDFATSSALRLFIHLISHENMDISGDVIAFFAELVEMEISEENSDSILLLYKKMIENNFLELIVQNLMRMNENKQDEFNTIHKTLSIIENLIEVMPTLAKTICDRTKILHWLVKKISKDKNSDKLFDDNKLYASEILTILLQNSKENQYTLVKMGGIDHILTTLADYRKRDPASEEEKEMLENLFDSLCICLIERENVEIFKSHQGIELMIRIFREKNFCSKLSLKVIDFALAQSPGSCVKFIDGLGLKFLLPVLMKRGIKGKKKEEQMKMDEHVLSSIRSLLKYSSDVYLDRIINKFRENNFEKIERLLEFNKVYSKQVSETELSAGDSSQLPALADIEAHENVEEQNYLKKLEAGLSILEANSFILAKLYLSKDADITSKLNQLMKLHNVDIGDIKKIIIQQANFMAETNKDREFLLHLAEELK